MGEHMFMHMHYTLWLVAEIYQDHNRFLTYSKWLDMFQMGFVRHSMIIEVCEGLPCLLFLHGGGSLENFLLHNNFSNLSGVNFRDFSF